MSDVITLVPRDDDAILAAEVAELLRKWLAMAEVGELVVVALVGEMADQSPVMGYSAAAPSAHTIGTLECMKAQLIERAGE